MVAGHGCHCYPAATLLSAVSVTAASDANSLAAVQQGLSTMTFQLVALLVVLVPRRADEVAKANLEAASVLQAASPRTSLLPRAFL